MLNPSWNNTKIDRSQLEDIPELEDEDWEHGQFADADLIDHHNTKKESNQI